MADLEPAALEHLRRQLVTGWYPLSPTGLSIPMAHNGIIFESVSLRVVVKDRQWHETRENHRFLAAFDEAEYVTVSSSYPGRAIPIGEDFTVRTRQIGDSFSHHFWHKTPMRRGQFYDLRFRLVPDGDAAEDEIVVVKETSRAFHEPIRLAQFQTVFLGLKPSLLWRYDRLTYFERPGLPAKSRLLALRGDSVTVQFHDLYGGLFDGVAWEW